MVRKSLIIISIPCCSAKMDYCPHCGEEIEQNGPFCGHCGSKVDDATGGAEEPSEAVEGSTTQPGDEPVVRGDQKVVPKEEAGVVGITIGILSSIGIMAGSMFPISQSCRRYNFGENVSCSSLGGILDDPIIAIILFAFGMVLLLLVVDDFKEIGILGSWEPRKTRVYGGYGGVVMFILLVAVLIHGQPMLGGVILFLSAATLLLFSGIVGFWRIAFRKKAGAK